MIDDQEIDDEDTSLTFDIISDELSAVNGGATIEVNGSTLTLTPPVMSGEVIVTVSDGCLH